MSYQFPECVEISPQAAEKLDTLGICHVGAINVDLPAMAWLVFVLRHLPDTDYFPRGKWATIQSIEAQLELASKEVAREIEMATAVTAAKEAKP